jgi:hypothetical protein
MDSSTAQTARQSLKSIRHLNNDLKRLVNVSGYRCGTLNAVLLNFVQSRFRSCSNIPTISKKRQPCCRIRKMTWQGANQLAYRRRRSAALPRAITSAAARKRQFEPRTPQPRACIAKAKAEWRKPAPALRHAAQDLRGIRT